MVLSELERTERTRSLSPQNRLINTPLLLSCSHFTGIDKVSVSESKW